MRSALENSVAAILVTLVLLPDGLPVLPTQTMINMGIWNVRKDYADMIGWPELTQQVIAVYQQLTPSARASTMILANNYGEAGALQFYGKGLPTVVCPELTYYYWAPAQMTPSTLIVVGYPRDYLVNLFGNAEQLATITNAYGIHNEEFGTPIWLVQNPTRTLGDVWPQLKSLD